MKEIELPPLPEYSELGENYGYTAEDMQAYARAAVEANSVPDGWKPVPVEPTPEMLNAANVQAQKEFASLGLGDGSRIDASKAAANYYRAMLSASPAPAQQKPDFLELMRDELLVMCPKKPAQQERKPMTDPCPGCKKGVVCRTPKCGRLALPVDHPLRSGIKE